MGLVAREGLYFTTPTIQHGFSVIPGSLLWHGWVSGFSLSTKTNTSLVSLNVLTRSTSTGTRVTSVRYCRYTMCQQSMEMDDYRVGNVSRYKDMTYMEQRDMTSYCSSQPRHLTHISLLVCVTRSMDHWVTRSARN